MKKHIEPYIYVTIIVCLSIIVCILFSYWLKTFYLYGNASEWFRSTSSDKSCTIFADEKGTPFLWGP